MPVRPQPPAGPPRGSRQPMPGGPANPAYGGGPGYVDRGAPMGPGVPPYVVGTPTEVVSAPNRPAGEAVSPEAWAPAGGPYGPGAPGPVLGENDQTMPAKLPTAEAAAAPPEAAQARKPVRRRDIAVAGLLYVVGVAAAFGFAYDLFAKLFDLVHNRCALQKKDFTVQCDVIRPPASALWGLLIGGGGMFMALVAALVLTAVAAMTGRRAWTYTAIALPVILLAGGAGHVLVATAIK
ncbi:hypothetical protein [Nocardia seriolae]|uniref:hypothetical protein n=1 Tax=Nocardia seriolae TaxID=37332 RepID=UPI001314D312|nr:hypothetical protein [Nocardia seriolae]QUN19746.1 hypothetical protein KEC46_10755 [Nocardia seriolae]WKY52564.1 hypothetical protein Q5P07_37995 [Nocardia seriolae]